MFEIKGLTAYYGTIRALNGVSITVAEGEVVSILGANGAGKSTLLKAVSGLIKPQKGSILYKGLEITGLSPHKLVGLGISHVPEGMQIFSHLTVKDNIQLGAYHYFKRRNRLKIQQRIDTIYKMFPILEKRHKQVAGTLSGGEQQMLSIARSLMGGPELVLFDEPSMGLAPLIVKSIFGVIKELNVSGKTIMLVEQSTKAALNVAHHGIVLEMGEVVLEGPAEALIDNPKVKEAYLGG